MPCTSSFVTGAMHLRAITSPCCRPPPHLISPPIFATAGTVPGSRLPVAVSGDSSVCDDSTVRPVGAVARPLLCTRGLSPVPHQMMRTPINSLGFFFTGAMHLRAVTSPCCRPPPHLISPPASATAGTVPGSRLPVAVSGDSAVYDDSTVRPVGAVARPLLCPRGLSPVPHQMMRIPIKSLGFSLQVPLQVPRTLRSCAL